MIVELHRSCNIILLAVMCMSKSGFLHKVVSVFQFFAWLPVAKKPSQPIGFLVQRFGNLNPSELSVFPTVSLRKSTNATYLKIKLDFAVA